MQPNRRDFLSASCLLFPAVVRGAPAPHLRFPTAARDRLAVASWSFRDFLDTPENRAHASPDRLIDIRKFPAMVAERYHVHNVELLGQHLRSTEADYLAGFRAAVKSAGAKVVNLPAGVQPSLYDPDSAKRAAAVAQARRWIDVAIALDCPSVRLNLERVHGTPSVALAAQSLTTVSEYGASKNVVVNLENDDLVAEDAFFLVKVIDRVNSPWLRALPDFCNSMLTGNEKFNYDAVTAMFHRAYNISHLKDSEVDNGKVFRIDLARTFAIARASGYKGYFSVEFEGEGDAYAGVEKLIDAGLKYLA